MLECGAWPPLDPRSWRMFAKKLWNAALENPIATRLVAPPFLGKVSMMVVSVHLTFRVALTICTDEEHHLQQV